MHVAAFRADQGQWAVTGLQKGGALRLDFPLSLIKGLGPANRAGKGLVQQFQLYGFVIHGRTLHRMGIKNYSIAEFSLQDR